MLLVGTRKCDGILWIGFNHRNVSVDPNFVEVCSLLFFNFNPTEIKIHFENSFERRALAYTQKKELTKLICSLANILAQTFYLPRVYFTRPGSIHTHDP